MSRRASSSPSFPSTMLPARAAASADTGPRREVSCRAAWSVTRPSLVRATVKRHGSGAMPRPWSIPTCSLRRSSCCCAHVASWTNWANPSVRPGQACGPAPKGSHAPGRWERSCHRAGSKPAICSGSPGTSPDSRPRSSGLTSTTLPAGTCVPSSPTGSVVIRAVIQVGGVRRRVSQTAWTGSTGPDGWVASHASSQAPAAIGTCTPAASIVATWWGGLARPGAVARASSRANRASRSVRRVRLQRRGGRPAEMTGARASIHARVRSAMWSRVRTSHSTTAATVDRATGRRRRTMASYASPGVVRSCSASVASHSRAKVSSPVATSAGVSGAKVTWPERVSPVLPERSPLRLTSPGKSKRAGSVRTRRASAGVVTSHGPWRPRDTAPVLGAERTAPSRPPADSTLSRCITARASLPVCHTRQSAATGGRTPHVVRLQLVVGTRGLDAGADAIHHGFFSRGWTRSTPGGVPRRHPEAVLPEELSGSGVRTPDRAASLQSDQSIAEYAVASA